MRTDSFSASVTAVDTVSFLESVARHPKGDADDLPQKGTVKRLLALSSADCRAASIACRLQQHAETVLLPKRRESQFPAQPPQMAVLRHEQLVQEPLTRGASRGGDLLA